MNSLSLLGSINPLLFPTESPDYVNHSAGIPILCQSCRQIFLQKPKYSQKYAQCRHTNFMPILSPNISPKTKIFSKILNKYKHSAGTPILCQSCCQIFLQKPKYSQKCKTNICTIPAHLSCRKISLQKPKYSQKSWLRGPIDRGLNIPQKSGELDPLTVQGSIFQEK